MTTTPLPPAPVLAARALTKDYGSARALDGASLAIAPGEHVAVMGPSGSGKTTLLHCMAGIITPDAGQVLLDGQPVQGWGEARRSELRRSRYGFVFQSGQLLPELPAEENVALPLMLAGVPRRAAVERARTWLGPLGLDGLGSRRPGELSGGRPSASPSPGRWWARPRWSSPTSRPARWTAAPAPT